MLKSKTIDIVDNNIAPSVFIESIEVEEGKINVFYRLHDKKPQDLNLVVTSPKWIANEYILNNLFLVIECGEQTYKQTLNFIKKKNVIKDYMIRGSITFNNIKTNGNINLAAYCANDNKTIIGESVREIILSNGIINKSNYNNNSLTYINKIKDLRHFNLEKVILASKKEAESKNQSQKLYISYPFGKKIASFAYFFDLEAYLDNKSNSYRILKKYNSFKQKILLKSKINENSIIFYKKLLTQKDTEDYKKINSSVKILKINKDLQDKKYLILSSDEEQKNLNLSEYLIKISIDVVDYANEFLKKEIINNLQEIKKFLIPYKEKFEFLSKNHSIEDVNVYMFEQEYEKEIDKIYNFVNILSNIYSFYTNKNETVFNSLFSSILHPLMTRSELLEKLLSSINFIERAFNAIIKEINVQESHNSEVILQNTPSFVHEFKNIFDLTGENFINYNYDCFNGYDVISHEDRETRLKNVNNLLKIIPNETFEERKNLESEKYFGNRMPDIVKNLRHFSISYLDNKELSFNLLKNTNFVEGKILDSSGNEVILDELLTIINNFNEGIISPVNKEESIFLELAKNNIYLYSISRTKNQSKSKNNINILFDSNEDSKELSRKFLLETKFNSLYYIVDKNKFIMPSETSIIQVFYSIRDKSFLNTKILLTPANVEDEKQKSKLIFLYNNFFKFKEIVSGDVYSLHFLSEELINPIFIKKLKFFNNFYIVQKQNENIEQNIDQTMNTKLLEELKTDIPPALLNRTVTKEHLNFSMSDL